MCLEISLMLATQGYPVCTRAWLSFPDSGSVRMVVSKGVSLCMGVPLPGSVSACVLLAKLPDQATEKGQPPPLFKGVARLIGKSNSTPAL